jgi:hypothetical protein
MTVALAIIAMPNPLRSSGSEQKRTTLGFITLISALGKLTVRLNPLMNAELLQHLLRYYLNR